MFSFFLVLEKEDTLICALQHTQMKIKIMRVRSNNISQYCYSKRPKTGNILSGGRGAKKPGRTTRLKEGRARRRFRMKNLASASFYRGMDQLVSASNPGLKKDRWQHAGAEFSRMRHSFSAEGHSFSVETLTVSKPSGGARGAGWTLLVVKEYWRGADAAKTIHTSRWSNVTQGSRAQALAYVREACKKFEA
jgi:hypothetical protein